MNCTWSFSCLVIPEYEVYCSVNEFKYNIFANSVLNLIIAFTSIVLNGSVIWVIYSCRRLWTPYYMILLSLAVTDFTAGLCAQPLHVARILLLAVEKRAICCLDIATVAVGYTLLAISFFTISYVTYERFLAVFYPFQHARRCTRKISSRWLIAIWMFGTLYGIVGSLPHKSARIAIIGMVTVIGTVFCVWNGFAYSKIFLTASRIRRKIRQERQRFVNDEKLVKEANAAKTTCVIVASLFIFYGPALVTTAVGKKVHFFPKYVNIWAYSFMLMNSTANPLVYCYFCRDIGKEMNKLWRRFRRQDISNMDENSVHNSMTIRKRDDVFDHSEEPSLG